MEVIENGCEHGLRASAAAPRPVDVSLPGPVAGLVGHLSDRIDLLYLEAVADTGESLLLVGPRDAALETRRFDRLVARPNVQWVGPKAYAGCRATWDHGVGLVPYADKAFNRASFR